MKKIVLSSLIILSTTCLAITPEERAIQEKENIRMLSEMGLTLPGSGIKLVPRSMLGLTQEEILNGEKEQEEFKQNGYINKYINRPHELLSMTKESLKLSDKNNIQNDSYTGLKENINQFKLAFSFPSINKNKKLNKNNIISIAATPMGGFHKELGGWSGGSEFFIHNDIGTCSYSVMNVKASNTAARLAQEDVTYNINGKPTILMPVEGSESSGFIYYLRWFDDENFHELECANMNYSYEINDKLINLALEIDNIK